MFFFQAEDGIRDIGVTGVQTCALPIWSIDACSGSAWVLARAGVRNSPDRSAGVVGDQQRAVLGDRERRGAAPHLGALLARYPRSEEHTSELQSRQYLVCRLLLEKKKDR